MLPDNQWTELAVTVAVAVVVAVLIWSTARAVLLTIAEHAERGKRDGG